MQQLWITGTDANVPERCASRRTNKAKRVKHGVGRPARTQAPTGRDGGAVSAQSVRKHEPREQQPSQMMGAALSNGPRLPAASVEPQGLCFLRKY